MQRLFTWPNLAVAAILAVIALSTVIPIAPLAGALVVASSCFLLHRAVFGPEDGLVATFVSGGYAGKAGDAKKPDKTGRGKKRASASLSRRFIST